MCSIRTIHLYLNINAASAEFSFCCTLVPMKRGSLFVKVKFNFIGKIHNLKYSILASDIPLGQLMIEEKLTSMLNN